MPKTMSAPASSPAQARPAVSSAGEAGIAPDAQRLQAQLAGLVEKEGAAGELRPLLEFFRTLLNASAVALLPADGTPAEPGCVVGTRGITAGSVAQLVPTLAGQRAVALSAPALGADGYTLAVPVVRETRPLFWLVAQLTVASPRDLQAFLVLLQALAGSVLYREQRRATQEAHWALERTSGILEILRRAGSELDFAKACRIAVDDLRDYLGCSRVFLATRHRFGLQMRAVSGMARIDGKSTSHAPFEAAMREAVQADTRLDFRPDSARAADTAAHEMLQAQTAAAQLTTVPFTRQRGAILLEWDAAPDPRAAALLEATAPFLAAFGDLLDRARPNPALHAAQRVWTRLSAHRRRAAAIVGVALAALLAFPFHYPIKADCRLAPTVKRVIAAPFHGQLKKSFVLPGDHIEAGAPLAEMENRELKLKEAELIAAREKALKQRDKALANDGEGGDFSAAQVANFEAESVGRELDLVQRKIALLTITAPLAGVVVSGDLRRAEGLPVQQGQVLFEVAPLDRMIVEIDVPDREISRVRAGLPMRFRLDAFSGERWSSPLDKVHPQSEQRDGRNVFVCEAGIANADRALDLRPGMHGRAVISGDRRPLVWILTHRLWEFIVTSLLW
jgi:multidrug efflux pump subunit AcrA (membrane-fusion protein)